MLTEKKVSVALEHRFFIYDGKLYTQLSFPYAYWKNYLNYFHEVTIIARAKVVDSIDDSFQRVDGQGVLFNTLPYYIGVRSFFKTLPSLLICSKKIVRSSDYFILRSGNVSNLLWVWTVLYKKKYVREYPGNIYEGVVGFGGNSLKIKLLAMFLDSIAKVQSKFSKANSFVSQYCEKLYGSQKPSYVFSSFDLDEIVFRKKEYSAGNFFKVVSVGRLEGEKGHLDLINSLSYLEGNIELNIIGDGTQRPKLEKMAKDLGVNVIFHGAITDREQLFTQITASDLFVIPSHTEGMPRSLLEAMALGMPCIGTSVGGIPEVIQGKYLVKPQAPSNMAKLINGIANDCKERGRMGAKNLSFIESNYSRCVLDKRKVDFWSELYK
ncbi:glycosyltransferase family 4 protein [Psychrobium sp. 1_MG-2023]|uniref:glycosyltransferase family 4 protein n=1 Tax=Psychrobium sp. 1_MG-2023 TaxID=3062624 RepID=UPI00267A495F|nr:glycosyltransferase family 4 protein [Psychrobium sp. 1_MG-2023]MDP2562113.1 glycosyltransferase family 4 protein [Psychrobium sp. 1_MG-2023]